MRTSASSLARLPACWPAHIKSSLLHAISLATTALTCAWGRAASGRGTRAKLEAELDRARTEIALLREEVDIKDARWSRLRSRRRPHYTPIQRMRILQLKAARHWSCEQASRAFLIDEQTLCSWMRRVDEQGNFVRYLVRQLKVLCPAMGKVHMAQVLARVGLHLGATTVGRIARETAPPLEDRSAEEAVPARTVTAKYAGHVMHVDLTTVPTGTGFWVPWMPFALPQSWPFCWWVAIALDHFSRAVVGFAVFPKRPTSAEVQRFLDRAIRRSGTSPKYIITDKGRQFWCDAFKQWCRRRGIQPRFGAVGKFGSIAVVERYMRSLKSECTRRILVPLTLTTMRREIALYVLWYNQFRPSMALEGKTPHEVYYGLRPANAMPRFEPRARWPMQSPCAAPQASVKGRRGTTLLLVVTAIEDRKHLPLIELRHAA